MRISDWSSDVCSSDLGRLRSARHPADYRPWPGQRLGRSLHEVGEPRTVPALPGLLRRGGRRLLSRRLAVPGRTARRLTVHAGGRSEEHTSELQSLMRTSYAVFCLKKNHISTNKMIKTATMTRSISM